MAGCYTRLYLREILRYPSAHKPITIPDQMTLRSASLRDELRASKYVSIQVCLNEHDGATRTRVSY